MLDIKFIRENPEVVKKTIKLVVGRMPQSRQCECASALKTAIVTDPALMMPELRQKLKLLIGKYL